MDLRAVMNLAGDNLLGMCSPERDWLPYWQVLEDGRRGRLWFRGDGCNAHNIGRLWDALLRLEARTGYAIPQDVEDGMLRNLRAYTRNPWRLLLDVADDPEDASGRYIHSFRETMLAYAALARFRGSREAERDGAQCVAAMDDVCADPAVPDFRPARNPRNASHPCYFHGRAIEGLVRFAEASGDERALDLAGRLAAHHLDRTTRPDGSLAPDHGNHTHSYLNTLRGLLLYGTVARRPEYVERVRATYASAVTALITPSGFVTHDIDPKAFALGDAAAAGDVAQLALWLARATPDAGLHDDVERITRSRLVPSQIVVPPDIEPRDPDGSDETRQIAARMRGALGGTVGHTWGKSCVTDITAAALHSLTDIAGAVIDRDERGVWVHLHFDAKGPHAQVGCERGRRARLRVETSGDTPLYVRVPGWAPRGTLEVSRNGVRVPPDFRGSYLFLPPSTSSLDAEIGYDLPTQVTIEQSRMQFYHRPNRPYGPADGALEYTMHWQGDEVRSADPMGDCQPLYPRAR